MLHFLAIHRRIFLRLRKERVLHCLSATQVSCLLQTAGLYTASLEHALLSKAPQTPSPFPPQLLSSLVPESAFLPNSLNAVALSLSPAMSCIP